MNYISKTWIFKPYFKALIIIKGIFFISKINFAHENETLECVLKAGADLFLLRLTFRHCCVKLNTNHSRI